MATPFPFNKLPGIPAVVLDQLIPIYIEQRNKLISLVSEIALDAAEAPLNTVCDDPTIKEIKNKLKELETIIQNIQGILNSIQPIVSIFNTLKSVASVIISIMLATPAVQGKPEGTTQAALTSGSDTIESIGAAVLKIQQLINPLRPDFNKVANVIITVNNLLESICNEGVDIANTDPLPSATNNESPESGSIAGIPGTYISDRDILSQFPSEFYQDVNVADSDIQARLDLILELLEESVDVALNLNESPSDIIIQSGTPANDVGRLNDYYIDNTTQQVYGPKPFDTSWQ